MQIVLLKEGVPKILIELIYFNFLYKKVKCYVWVLGAFTQDCTTYMEVLVNQSYFDFSDHLFS